MKQIIFPLLLLAATALNCTAQQPKQETYQQIDTVATVYMTRDISPESLVRIYKALGVKAKGRVAIKISTGESSKTNHLRPDFISPLVNEVNGTLVECNTAYGGSRSTTEAHMKAISERGYDKIAKVDIMDADGSMELPVRDTTWIKTNLVGSHLANYDFMINLAHFKGHQMGGFGGVLKNQSIGIASADGKAYIHTAGKQKTVEGMWKHVGNQDGFLESMASAAASVHDYFKQEGKDIVYINVMNNMSIDCDCVDHPAPVKLEDYGILASTDPVALDQACVDIINNQKVTAKNDPTDLLKRIDKQHGTHTIDWAEKIGLGSKKYTLVNIDKK